MTDKKFFIDFDETLFNHYVYQEWLAKFLNQKFNLDGKSYLNELNNYHEVQDKRGLLRLYKHEQHLLETTGLNWSFLSGEIEKEIKSKKLHFCYSESHRFILDLYKEKDLDIRLLTYGNADYQRFKIGLCKFINNIPIHVVNEAKGNFLAKNYSDAKIKGILVDDKTLIETPKNWQHVWLNRNKIQRPKKSNNLEIDRLDYKEVLASLLS